jgi:hypothetical protein
MMFQSRNDVSFSGSIPSLFVAEEDLLDFGDYPRYGKQIVRAAPDDLLSVMICSL